MPSLRAAHLLHGILGWYLIPLGVFIAYDFVLRTFIEGTRAEKYILPIIISSVFLFAYLNTFYWHWQL